MKTYTFAMAALTAASLLQAEVATLDTIEVTAASRTLQDVKDVTESVTIISKESLEDARVTTLQEALVKLGNIAMNSSGGPGQLTNVYLRGFDSRQALILIDGVRYNDPTGLSGAQYEFIDLHNVERIEIIKGAQSGVWGADASAGVINIVTASAQHGTHVSANLQTGSFNTDQGSVQLSHRQKSFDIQAGVSRYKTDGFSAAEPTKGSADYGTRGDELGWDDDAYISNTYNLKLGYDITKQDRVEASYRHIDGFLEFDTWAGIDGSNENEIDNRFYQASYRHNGSVHDISAQHSRSTFERSQWGGYSGEVTESLIQDCIGYAKDAFVRVGGSYQRFEHQKSAGANLDKHYNAKALFMTNYNRFNWSEALGRTIVTESLRYDNYSAFESKVTGKLGLKQFLRGEYYVSVNYGTGYNAPTLYHLYDGFSGNPDLQPETTKSLDVTIGSDKLTLTWFESRITDMFNWTLAGYENLSGTSKIKGVELGYHDDFFDQLAFDASYTYLHAKNSNDDYLGRRPKHQLDVAATYFATESFDINLNGQYIGKRYDGTGKTGAQTGKYTVWNAVANYRIDKNLTLYGKIDNLTDKYYQTVDGYGTAERSFYVGLNVQY